MQIERLVKIAVRLGLTENDICLDLLDMHEVYDYDE
jgi:hypothetical protein